MGNRFGRPPTQVIELYFRLPEHLFPLIIVKHPELFKPGNPGVFKHGALSRYISDLIREDLRDQNTTSDPPA